MVFVMVGTWLTRLTWFFLAFEIIYLSNNKCTSYLLITSVVYLWFFVTQKWQKSCFKPS